jgi:hypothetical protein
MIVPVALDGVLKPNVSAMRYQLLNKALVAATVAGVVAGTAAVATKPSSWTLRGYPQGALAAVDRVEQQHPAVHIYANEMFGDWLLLQRPALRGQLAFDIRFELASKRQLKQLVDIRRQVDGWQQAVSSYGLFVLSKDPEGPLAAGLLRQPGARALYRGHGLIVVWRPPRGSKSNG